MQEPDSSRRRAVSPKKIDQLIARDGAVRAERKPTNHGPRPFGLKADKGCAPFQNKRTEHLDPDRRC
ncbi:hypothetical protein GCM10027614_25130 [Micromonospora vulcania]